MESPINSHRVSRDGEHNAMSKRRVFIGLVVGGLIGLATGEAHASTAELIWTVSYPGGPPIAKFDWAQNLPPIAHDLTPLQLDPINDALLSVGSGYQFVSLGGSSISWPGGAISGALEVHGEIQLLPGFSAGSTLELTLTLGRFELPDGVSGGTLVSTSSGTFTNQAANGGYTAWGSFMDSSTNPVVVSTPTYPVTPSMSSNSSKPPTPIPHYFAPYQLEDDIIFALTPVDATKPRSTFSLPPRWRSPPSPSRPRC
jgi:hypothetical protein